MNKNEISHIPYSSFSNSNWYIYWDKDYAHMQEQQLLVVWHNGSEALAFYDHGKLEELVEEGGIEGTLPYYNSLPEEDKEEFISICYEFIEDVKYEFKRKYRI